MAASNRDVSPVLDLQGVTFMRESRAILAEVDLRVAAGEHWALLGPNGAGKSTLLDLCGAVTFPSRGSVRILGHRIGEVDLRELRRDVGLVKPRHPLRNDLAARTVVLTGATGTTEIVPHWQPSADDFDRAEQLMKSMGVDPAEPLRWSTMSQGERGRTLIARALMQDPQVLLLDEPSTGLDLPSREQMLDAVDDLRRARPGLTTVLVTHHFEELPASTTHAMLLRGGRATAAGPVDEVLTSDAVSAAFEHPIRVERRAGRWSAMTA